MIELRQLRYFLAIVEQGSLTRAAEVLRVAQPALSGHVRRMEAHLGTPLLLRTPKGVQPTEAGQALVRHARLMLDQLALAEEEIRGQRDDPAGLVRLGLPGTIGQILAVPLIRAVRARHPRIELRVAEAMSGFVQDWLEAGRIDIAVLYEEAAGRGIRTERLLEEELVVIGAPARAAEMPQGALPLAAALRAGLILPGEGHGLRALLEAQAAVLGQPLATLIDVDSYQSIKALVAEGMGWSILPRNAVASEAARGALRIWPIRDPQLRRHVHLAHAARRPVTGAVAAVLELARDTLHGLVRDGTWTGAAPVAAPGQKG